MPLRFFWTLGGSFPEEQVNSGHSEAETEEEVKEEEGDDKGEAWKPACSVQSFSRFLTFLRWRRLMRFFSEDDEVEAGTENTHYMIFTAIFTRNSSILHMKH